MISTLIPTHVKFKSGEIEKIDWITYEYDDNNRCDIGIAAGGGAWYSLNDIEEFLYEKSK